MQQIAWINGQPETGLPLDDRGLAYGDGLFETVRIAGGQLTLAAWHKQRLSFSSARLALALDSVQLWQEVGLFLQAQAAGDGVLKIIITRGSGGRGYNSAGCQQVRRILSLHPLPVYPASHAQQGIAVRLCRLRIGQSSLAGIKHLNRLEQVLARSEWQDSAYGEGLVCDFAGRLIEGTMSNLFVVDSQGVLVTPSLDCCGVAGVCRQYILDNAPGWGIAVREQALFPDDLSQARELFVANSVNGVWPVVSCGQSRWPVGALTRLIRDKVAEELNA